MIYNCKECGFKYKKQELAKECEEYCKKHKACNSEIIRKAIK